MTVFPIDITFQSKITGKKNQILAPEKVNHSQLHRSQNTVPGNELLTGRDHTYFISVSSEAGIVPDTIHDECFNIE